MLVSNMKRDGFQRTVKLRQNEREIGDAPSIGHVDRVFGKVLPKGMLRKRKRGTGKRANRRAKKERLVIMTWSLVFAGIVLVVIVGMVWLWLDPGSHDETAAKTHADNPGNGTRAASRSPSPSRDDAVNLVKRALLVRDPVKVPEFFRIDSATPAEVVGFLENLVETDGLATGYQWLSSLDANRLPIDGVLVISTIGDKRRERMAFLTPDAKGRWRIDFDAFARTVTPSWGEILNGRARQGVVRILFVKDNYYNGPFGDESQWTCYRLGSPELTDDILGYCRNDSPQATAMKLILSSRTRGLKTRGLLRATLEIRHTEGAEARQFEITRVLAEDWVRSSEPFDKAVD